MTEPRNEFSPERFWELPIVAILRGFDAPTVRELVRACRRGGLKNVEVAMNSSGAEELIRLAKREVAGELNVGAGTVRTIEELERALACGADFIVTPVIVSDVISACRDRGVPVFPGALTPTEIAEGWRLGASAVKVFPARGLGPEYIRDLKAPLADVRLMPTGGITLESVAAYREAGADAFGIGGPLFPGEKVAAGDWAAVEARARGFAGAWVESEVVREAEG